MSERLFDRETLLDLTVNVIPLGILAFFVAVYALVGSFPDDPLIVLIQMSIILLTAGALAVLTGRPRRIGSGDRRGGLRPAPDGPRTLLARHGSGDSFR